MAVLWALAGLVVGPFLSLAIYRLPHLDRLVAPADCPKCHGPRPMYALSALLSRLLGARGRCGRCGTGADGMAVGVELATGVAFWLLFLRFGAAPQLLLYSLYASILIVVAVIDWQHRQILNRVSYPGIALSLLLTPLLTSTTWAMALAGLMTGGGLFGLLYVAGHLLFRQEALGLGDVKLAMMLGSMAGFPMVMWWLLVGSLFGAVAGLVLLVVRRRSLHDFMPYGTTLCLGAFVALFVNTSFP